MDDHRGHRAKRSHAKLATVSFFSPVVAVAWASTQLFGPGRWKRKLIALSVSGNCLFVVVLIVGYYETVNPDQRGGALVAPDCVERSQGPLMFCEAPSQSELIRIVPNAIYVAFGGLHRARFEFADENFGVLTEVTLCDRYGRPWIDAHLEDGTFIYSRYADDEQVDPDVSLMDRDRDGVPDKMVDWVRGQAFESLEGITWRPLKDEE